MNKKSTSKKKAIQSAECTSEAKTPAQRKTRAERIADTAARQFVSAHIETLAGDALEKAYKSKAALPNPPKEEKIKAIKKVLTKLDETTLDAIYQMCPCANASESSKRSTLKSIFKKAEAAVIWQFIAENPIPRTKKERKGKPADTSDNGDAEEI